MTDHNRFAPCPFCGSNDLYVDDVIGTTLWHIWCSECETEGPTACCTDDAIKLWNERHATLHKGRKDWNVLTAARRMLYATTKTLEQGCDSCVEIAHGYGIAGVTVANIHKLLGEFIEKVTFSAGLEEEKGAGLVEFVVIVFILIIIGSCVLMSLPRNGGG